MEILSFFLKTHEISPILWYEYFIIVMISQCFLSLGNINQINSSTGGREVTEQGYQISLQTTLCNGYLLVCSRLIEYQNMFIITEGGNVMKYWMKWNLNIILLIEDNILHPCHGEIRLWEWPSCSDGHLARSCLFKFATRETDWSYYNAIVLL